MQIIYFGTNTCRNEEEWGINNINKLQKWHFQKGLEDFFQNVKHKQVDKCEPMQCMYTQVHSRFFGKFRLIKELKNQMRHLFRIQK